MKKLFRTNSILMAVVVLLVSSCSKFDDSTIWQALNKHTEEIAELKGKCDKLNSDLESLKQIVSAIQEGDYIISYAPLSDGSGYTIVFKSGKSIVIYNGSAGKDGRDGVDGQDGKDGKDGADGKDGTTPQIGIGQFTDGLYYWTLNGEWLLDAQGNKIPTTGKDGKDGRDGVDGQDGADGKEGITPQLKIDGGYWYLSVNNGASWTKLGKATGADGADGKDGKDGDSFFRSVVPGEDCIVFTLVDGTELKLPYYNGGDNVVTGDCSDLRATSVTVFGWCNKEDKEGLSVLYGIQYSATDLNADAKQIWAESRDADNKFCCLLTGLSPDTKYYYRAFSYLNKEYSFGEIKTFTTLASSELAVSVECNAPMEFVSSEAGCTETGDHCYGLDGSPDWFMPLTEAMATARGTYLSEPEYMFDEDEATCYHTNLDWGVPYTSWGCRDEEINYGQHYIQINFEYPLSNLEINVVGCNDPYVKEVFADDEKLIVKYTTDGEAFTVSGQYPWEGYGAVVEDKINVGEEDSSCAQDIIAIRFQISKGDNWTHTETAFGIAELSLIGYDIQSVN